MHWLWANRTNKKYYTDGRYTLYGATKFRGFPPAFVFPGLFMVTFSLFLSPMLSKSVALIVSNEGQTCRPGCTVVAGVVMSLCIGI